MLAPYLVDVSSIIASYLKNCQHRLKLGCVTILSVVFWLANFYGFGGLGNTLHKLTVSYATGEVGFHLQIISESAIVMI